MRGLATAITEHDSRSALIKMYCERFQLGTVFRLAISQCTLYAFRPDFIRYIDNSLHFGFRFEIELENSQPLSMPPGMKTQERA
jgi:uncharacterized protein YhbP (UPF0306 family)